MTLKIAVLVGSLRKDSLNRKIAKQLIEFAPKSVTLDLIKIEDLPLYSEDLDKEGSVPASWSRFRNEIKSYQAILFVTPEYNRSVPAALKNAIDVGSRPYGQSVWQKKPAAIISASPGAIGGFGANHHLRQSLVFLDMPILQQPEAYLGHAGNLFDEQGAIKNEDTRKLLQNFLNTFISWIQLNTQGNK